MEKICPHCNQAFECRQDNIWDCDCMFVFLSSEARQYLHFHYPEKCLCTNCLNEISKMVQKNTENEMNIITDSQLFNT